MNEKELVSLLEYRVWNSLFALAIIILYILVVFK